MPHQFVGRFTIRLHPLGADAKCFEDVPDEALQLHSAPGKASGIALDTAGQARAAPVGSNSSASSSTLMQNLGYPCGAQDVPEHSFDI